MRENLTGASTSFCRIFDAGDCDEVDVDAVERLPLSWMVSMLTSMLYDWRGLLLSVRYVGEGRLCRGLW